MKQSHSRHSGKMSGPSSSSSSSRAKKREEIKGNPYHGMPRRECSGCGVKDYTCRLTCQCAHCGCSLHKQCVDVDTSESGEDLCPDCASTYSERDDDDEEDDDADDTKQQATRSFLPLFVC